MSKEYDKTHVYLKLLILDNDFLNMVMYLELLSVAEYQYFRINVQINS